MRKITLLISILFVLPFLPVGFVDNVEATSVQSNLTINSGDSVGVFVGNIDSGKELEIDYSVDQNIDVLLMTNAQYLSWQNGSSGHIMSGSDYDDDGDSYTFTIQSTDSYYVVFDNSNQAGFASDTGDTVTGDATLTVVIASTTQINTRSWVESDSYDEVEIQFTDAGDVLSIEVDCDIGFTSSDDLDFLVLDSMQVATLQGNNWEWNRHASFEDTCSYSWEYQTGKDSGWSLLIDNTDQARTNSVNHGVMVDVKIGVRSLVPLFEIADTSRMIDSGDYYRIDTGYVPANGVIDIDFSFWSHGTAILTDDLDILVMESSEASQYENSNNAVILGHASTLDAGSQSWSYQFPNAGFYSIIFDNTDEPSGGAGDGSDIQVEIGITSLSIPSLFGNIWTSWHQSKHYSDEGDYMALDLGIVNLTEGIYYYVDGKNEGGSWGSKEFDILFMNKTNYDLYVNGSTFDVIENETHYQENGIIPKVQNISLSSSDHYLLVLDAADGPNSGSADANGDWIWEFMVLSGGNSISNLQAEDDHYEDSITVGTISSPDSDNDGVRNGIDECSSTPAGQSVDSTGCSSSQLDSDGDGVNDGVDQCPNTPIGDTVDSTGCTVQTDPDSDGDGINDSVDQCPNTPVGESVNSAGCSSSQLDSDGDGIKDNLDQCPNTPSGESADSTGCSSSQLDGDSDGISDNLDQCPNTPSGESADSTGCSTSQLDGDSDGISDNLDQCPNTPAGESVDSTGCTVQPDPDGDGDGINDSVDQCPNTPSSESVNSAGCSSSQLDSDGDGIKDNLDQCPNTPAGESVDSTGCTVQPDPDGDGDGINDSVDQCPNTPSGESADSTGCSSSQLDSDGDGVMDNLDQCPNTPAGESVDSTGCTVQPDPDGDGDGINDSVDQCPNTSAGESVDSTGCTVQSDSDNDSDGINDSVDQCPNTPAGESVDSTGCTVQPPVSDGDGVSDENDQCPNTPPGEIVDQNGCSASQLGDSNDQEVIVDDESDSNDGSSSLPGFTFSAVIVAFSCAVFASRTVRNDDEIE